MIPTPVSVGQEQASFRGAGFSQIVWWGLPSFSILALTPPSTDTDYDDIMHLRVFVVRQLKWFRYLSLCSVAIAQDIFLSITNVDAVLSNHNQGHDLKVCTSQASISHLDIISAPPRRGTAETNIVINSFEQLRMGFSYFGPLR